jgi:ornithine decarboxylase
VNIEAATLPRTGTDFASAARLIGALQPREPIYGVYGHRLQGAVDRFQRNFSGRTLYAVKANPAPQVLRHLHAAGIRHFDTASIPEIALIRGLFPDARCYFMAPVRPLGALEEAYRRYGLRDFAVDCREELERILSIADARADTTLYVRLALPRSGALFELADKFGAGVEEAATLMQLAYAQGCRVALTFHVGSQCRNPIAFADALGYARQTIERAQVPLAALDIGGGFPAEYPGSDAAPLEAHLEAIAQALPALSLPSTTPLLAEPGRALVADGLSVITQVTLRHGAKLYLNDGIYGSFAELKLAQGAIGLPARYFRAGSGPEAQPLSGPESLYTVFGPTCDSYDVFPAAQSGPAELATGDFVEFGMMGAYSIAMRTAFNGFYPDRFAEIGEGSEPPAA